MRASRSHPSRADASPRARRAAIRRIALLCEFFPYCISISPISCPCTLSRMQGTRRPVTTGGMTPHHLARDRLVGRWDAAAENSFDRRAFASFPVARAPREGAGGRRREMGRLVKLLGVEGGGTTWIARAITIDVEGGDTVSSS